MDDEEIRDGFTGVPAVFRGIELILNFFRIHGFQLIERNDDKW